MSHISATAIRGAIIDRLEGLIVSVIRSPEDGEAIADLFEGAEMDTRAQRALSKPTFHVEISRMGKHPSSPMGPTSLLIYDLGISIRISYNLQGVGVEQVDYNDRKAVAEEQADKFFQALTFPRALESSPTQGADTNIVSGLLIPDAPFYRPVTDRPELALYEVEQNYTAIVTVNAATS